jgi:Calcineurin-like phosphoesterase
MSRHLRSTLAAVVAMAACATLTAAPLGRPSPPPGRTGRLVAIGDIHGDLQAFIGILQRTGLVDADLKWSGRNATLVQAGDMIDRGPASRGVMDLVMRLQHDAPRQGGRVIALLGNHEAMNIYGDWQYVVPADYAAFADGESEHRRRTAYAAARALGRMPADEAAWMAAHPAGFVERAQAFGPDGKYGRWLRSLPAVVKVDDTLFAHGGVSPGLTSWTIERINQTMTGEMRAFDDARRFLVAQHLALPADLLLELAGAARLPVAATSADVMRFRGYDQWLSVSDSGPLWFRGYARWTDAEGEAEVPAILAAFGAARAVVGHNAERGRIVPRFGDRVYLIDTGMFAGYFPEGRASALTIEDGAVAFVYAGPGGAER